MIQAGWQYTDDNKCDEGRIVNMLVVGDVVTEGKRVTASVVKKEDKVGVMKWNKIVTSLKMNLAQVEILSLKVHINLMGEL